jgi:hypothetical protein
VLQIWEAATGAIEDSGAAEGIWEEGAVDLSDPLPGRKVEACVVDLNLLKKNEISVPCQQCGEVCEPANSVMCGSCGRKEHRRCAAPKARRSYWYCEACMTAWGEGLDTNDPALDTTMQGYLLGGESPDWWNEEERREINGRFKMQRGALIMVKEGEEKIVPPPYLRDAVIEETHSSMCHVGIARVKEAVGRRFWWPGWGADVSRVVANCLGCQLMDAVFRRRSRIGGHLAPNMPRVAWSLDAAPAIQGKHGRTSILVMVDDFSKLSILRVLP